MSDDDPASPRPPEPAAPSLDEVMAAMAGGDTAFLFVFVDLFGARVRSVVAKMLRDMGRGDIVADRDELDGLTLDACEVIFDRAAGWQPGGALPWSWAYLAIRSRVAVAIGHRVVELNDASGTDADGVDGEAGSQRGDVVTDLTGDDLTALRHRHPVVRLLDESICAVGTARNQELYWEYRIQLGMGDPSPSHTVARQFDMSPPAVRQAYKRHGDAVRQLVWSEPRFEPLRTHGWFAT